MVSSSQARCAAMSLSDVLKAEGLADSIIKVATDAGWTLSTFRHAADTPADLEKVSTSSRRDDHFISFVEIFPLEKLVTCFPHRQFYHSICDICVFSFTCHNSLLLDLFVISRARLEEREGGIEQQQFALVLWAWPWRTSSVSRVFFRMRRTLQLCASFGISFCRMSACISC